MQVRHLKGELLTREKEIKENLEDMRETKRVLGKMKVIAIITLFCYDPPGHDYPIAIYIIMFIFIIIMIDASLILILIIMKGSCWAIQGTTRCSCGGKVARNLDAD